LRKESMCSAKQLVEPVRRNGGVAGRHLPPEIARRAWDHHHDFDAIGRAQRPLLDPSHRAEHAPTHVCMRASATHQAHHDPHALELIILLGVMAAAAFLGQLEHALELKLEPMAAICIGIGGRSLWRRLGARARRSAERGGSTTFWLGGDPDRLLFGARSGLSVWRSEPCLCDCAQMLRR